MPGLGLDRLQRHPGLPEPGQAGVPQLVAGRMRQTRRGAGTGEDLVQPAHRQRPLPRLGPLSTTNTRSVSGTGWPLGVEVGRDRGEEPGGDRDQPLVAALALGDEHPPLGDPQVLQPQPEDLAAAQPAEHHRRDHRPVPVGAQRGGQRVDLRRGQDPRQPPGPPGQRHPLTRPLPLPPGRQTPRHRVRGDVAAGLQVREEPRDDRQAGAPPCWSTPRRAVVRIDRLQRPGRCCDRCAGR